MLKIGITGGIACGKSNITHLVRQRGYKVIDADEISKNLSQPGGTIYKALQKEFGLAYFKTGRLDRKMLGDYIFSHPEARKKIDQITHPLIVEAMQKQLSEMDEEIVFLDIPLLYEAHLEYLCDKIICVYLPYDVQLKRLMARDGIDACNAKQKMASQMDLETKVRKADYPLSTIGSFSQTEALLNEILNQIKGVKLDA